MEKEFPGRTIHMLPMLPRGTRATISYIGDINLALERLLRNYSGGAVFADIDYTDFVKGGHLNEKLYAYDWLHLNSTGSNLLQNKLKNYFELFYENQGKTNLTGIFDDVDLLVTPASPQSRPISGMMSPAPVSQTILDQELPDTPVSKKSGGRPPKRPSTRRSFTQATPPPTTPADPSPRPSAATPPAPTMSRNDGALNLSTATSSAPTPCTTTVTASSTALRPPSQLWKTSPALKNQLPKKLQPKN